MEDLERTHPDVLSVSSYSENVQPGNVLPDPLSVVKAELQHVRSGIAALEKRLKGLHTVKYR